MKHSEIKSEFQSQSLVLDDIIKNFNTKGKPFGNQERNSLKLFDFDDKIINVKSFKIPNIINQIAYRFLRKSKAQRSFEYANKLQDLNIGTPQPIAYYEYKTFFLFKKSYYVSEQVDCDLTYRELTTDLSYPNHEGILRAFTRFTFDLHEKRVQFLDHSPGNTLIRKTDKGYKFYLVDLNRMNFRTLDFETRIKNFAKLTIHKSMIEVMSDEYAKCTGENFEVIYNLMWKFTEDFQEKYHRRRRFKNKLKFWKRL